MALREVLLRARSFPGGSEEGAKVQLVLPVLRALGWDDTDFNQVQFEYPVETRSRGRVDIALRAPRRGNVALIEVKAVDKKLEDFVAQVLEYAFHDGVDICVLTTGLIWWLYLPREKGTPSERRFAILDVKQGSLDQLVDDFETYLSRSELLSHAAEQRAKQALRAGLEAERLLTEIPRVWRQMQAEPDHALVELIEQRVFRAIRLRPTADQIAEVLRGGTPVSPPTAPPGGELSKAERDAEIVRLRDSGMSFAEIGEHVGLSGARVSNIYRARKNSPAAPPGGGNSKAERDAEIVRLRDGGMTFREIAQRFNLSAVRVRKIYLRETASRPPENPPPTGLAGFVLWNKRYSEETWIGVWLKVAEAVYDRHSNEFERALQLRGLSQQYIMSSSEGRRRSRRIGNSPYYAYTYLSAAQCERRARELLDLFGYGADELEILYE